MVTAILKLHAFCSLFAIILPTLQTQEDTDWHPLLVDSGNEASAISSHHFESSAYQPSLSSLVAQQYQTPGGQCELYKVGFMQDLYFQYIQYKVSMPELKEFTLCFWNKFSNHTNDHPLFSYAVDGQPKSIYSWVSNTERSSYYSLMVDGHTFYRLNYPLRPNKWYHTCQSWNGKTGEWQIWVNAERVGRGFHNRLVGHVIPKGGIAITGQDQNQLGGGFQEGYGAPKGSGGMLGEFTLLQLYKVALTAGKAHRDHKHHHAHHYDHNGAEITTTPAPPPMQRPTQPPHPLITGGQLNPGAAFNIAAQQPQIVRGQQFQTQYVNGQFVPGLVAQQLNPTRPVVQRPGTQSLYLSPSSSGPNDLTSYSRQTFTFAGQPLLNSGVINHQSISDDSGVEVLSHNLFKRTPEKVTRTKRRNVDKAKRELILAGGHLIDDSLLTSGAYGDSLLDGLAGISDNEPVLQQQMKAEEREPAEAEVKAVMGVCSGCDPEPFSKALVIGWRSVGKKLYSGAIYTPARTECRVF